MNSDIGRKIKELRALQKMTLKSLSEKTGLSIGFLSQFERGMTTVDINSLVKMAEIFDVEMSDFFASTDKKSDDAVVRSYAHKSEVINTHIIQSVLSKNASAFDLLPRIYLLLPFSERENEEIPLYRHFGEEFIYILEGILTINIDGDETDLFPGDSVQIHSEQEHNWKNKTNKITKLLTINTPNPYGK